jgi:hypothetical protein
MVNSTNPENPPHQQLENRVSKVSASSQKHDLTASLAHSGTIVKYLVDDGR